jgi:hypothetical protein
MRNVEMIRLRRDLPCPFDWPAMALKPERADRLIPFFESLEFESLARGLRQGDLFSGL